MSLFVESDVSALRANQWLAAFTNLFPELTFTDDYLFLQLQAAEAEVSQNLKVFLEPTQVYPTPPTPDQITALSGMPYYVEPGYDYDSGFFQDERWGYIVARQHPIIAVQSINFIYPAPQQTVFAIPLDWLRIDYKYGQIRMVPATSTFIAPLGAFLMQALGGGRTIPSMIQMTYTAGLQNVLTDPRWANLLDTIYKRAVVMTIEGAFLPQSGSISADGLSESRSFDVSKYNDMINQRLYGPKGANGGLWTAIHGLTNTMMGVLA